MEMLFHVFVVPPAIIAGVVGIATWNIRSVIISFRVAFFACPICIYFWLTERPMTGFLIVVSSGVGGAFAQWCFKSARTALPIMGWTTRLSGGNFNESLHLPGACHR
jgi:hypothetical protein